MPFRLRYAALAVAAALSACSGTAPATAPVSSTALRVGGHAIRFGDNVHNDPFAARLALAPGPDGSCDLRRVVRRRLHQHLSAQGQ